MPEQERENRESTRTSNANESTSGPRLSRLELMEAVLLSVVAVATAWSGYQAALWNSERLKLYEQSAELRIKAERLSSFGDQERIYDSNTFNAWLSATLQANQKLAHIIERRFRDEHRKAFAAWLKTDPFTNPQAPPGPGFMPEYRVAKSEEAASLQQDAATVFNQGTQAATTGDLYVRTTVLLSTVLLFAAVGQKFLNISVRIGLDIAAVALLMIPLTSLWSLPRL